MANTYTQVYIHIIFAVKNRRSLIQKSFKNDLFKYITGILRNHGQKLLAINGIPDHVHILIGMKPNVALSDLVRDIKSNSSKFVNDHRWARGKFNWQKGFGAFSYSYSQLGSVIQYIENQDKHHAKRSFREEYLGLLEKFKVDFDKRYVFKRIV